jgi:hypothetical protein
LDDRFFNVFFANRFDHDSVQDSQNGSGSTHPMAPVSAATSPSRQHRQFRQLSVLYRRRRFTYHSCLSSDLSPFLSQQRPITIPVSAATSHHSGLSSDLAESAMHTMSFHCPWSTPLRKDFIIKGLEFVGSRIRVHQRLHGRIPHEMKRSSTERCEKHPPATAV